MGRAFMEPDPETVNPTLKENAVLREGLRRGFRVDEHEEVWLDGSAVLRIDDVDLSDLELIVQLLRYYAQEKE